MSTLISVYLLVAISVLMVKLGIAVIKRIPFLVSYVLLAPLAPLYVAWVNRKQRPAISRLLFALWLAFVLLFAAAVAIGR
ncbi:MAG: hypothetical protein IPM52_13225 [Bacteroidetes bacterium]|nr:hypothetical protein [Bacteroidota bacterium]